jgi:hypothetical protein
MIETAAAGQEKTFLPFKLVGTKVRKNINASLTASIKLPKD